jgi:putative ATP-binding protein
MSTRNNRVAEMIAEREGFVFHDPTSNTPSAQQGGSHSQSSRSYIPATASEPVEARSLEPQEDLQQLFDTIVTKNYLQRLDSSTIIPLEGGESSTMSWVQITKFVYEEDTFFPDKLAMLYASLHKQSSQVALLVRYERGKGVSLYLGTRDSADTELRMSSQTLQGALKADLPGVQYQVTSMNLSDKIRPEYSLASVSGVSSLLDDKKESFLQGLERLLNAAASGHNVGSFSALLLADKVREEEVYHMVHAYERLSTELSPLAEPS